MKIIKLLIIKYVKYISNQIIYRKICNVRYILKICHVKQSLLSVINIYYKNKVNIIYIYLPWSTNSVHDQKKSFKILVKVRRKGHRSLIKLKYYEWKMFSLPQGKVCKFFAIFAFLKCIHHTFGSFQCKNFLHKRNSFRNINILHETQNLKVFFSFLFFFLA